MLKRIISALLMVTGIVLFTLGVLSATLWKPATKVVASSGDVAGSALVLTREAREMVDSNVSLELKPQVEGQEFYVFAGSLRDIKAWIGSDSYALVTGLKSWDKLAIKNIGSGVVPNPEKSDLWVKSQKTSTDLVLSGSQLSPYQGYSLLIYSPSQKLPQLTLTWPLAVSTPFLWPGVGLGIFLFLIGLLWDIDQRRQRKRQAKRQARRARRAARLAELEAQTQMIPKVTDQMLQQASRLEEERKSTETVRAAAKVTRSSIRPIPPMPTVPAWNHSAGDKTSPNKKTKKAASTTESETKVERAPMPTLPVFPVNKQEVDN